MAGLIELSTNLGSKEVFRKALEKNVDPVTYTLDYYAGFLSAASGISKEVFMMGAGNGLNHYALSDSNLAFYDFVKRCTANFYDAASGATGEEPTLNSVYSGRPTGIQDVSTKIGHNGDNLI